MNFCFSLLSNSSNNNLPSVFIFNQTQRHVERETQSHRSRPTDSGASSCLRISRPIYPPTKPQQRNSGQSKSAKVRGLRRPTFIRHTRAQRDAIPDIITPSGFDALAMDQGTKRKAADGGSGSSDKRSKVSFSMSPLFGGEISHCDVRMKCCWKSHTFFFTLKTAEWLISSSALVTMNNHN